MNRSASRSLSPQSNRKGDFDVVMMNDCDIALPEEDSIIPQLPTEAYDNVEMTMNNDDDEIKPQASWNMNVPSVYKQATIMIGDYKWFKIFTNLFFWIRIFLFILSVFLVFLSISYAIAQLLTAELHLITECPQAKTREEIWAHSYDASLKYDDEHKLNEETQYGFTDESCWTTKKVEINTKQLWYSNTHDYEWRNGINAKFVLFGLVALDGALITLFIMFTVIKDIISIVNNNYHTQSKSYIKYRQNQMESNHTTKISPANTLESPTNDNSCGKCRKYIDYCVSLEHIYSKYVTVDKGAWIVMKFVFDLLEIILQSQALLLYNGYYVFDPLNKKDTYLANKPEFINLFAAIIAFNCFGSGTLWMHYLFLPTYCFGLRFERFLFFVDKFSDFLYIIFPFVLLYGDDYNASATTHHWLVSLAQLNIDSTLGFFATFAPLFFLVNKLFYMSYTAREKMKTQYFEQWKTMKEIVTKDGHKSVTQQNPKFNITERIASDGKISLDLKPIASDSDKNWTITNEKHVLLKRIAVFFMAAVLICGGFVVIISVTKHTKNAKKYCESVTESVFYENGILKEGSVTSERLFLLQRNPELFLWDHCLYKIYPFVEDDKYQCQCRVFVVEDWTQLQSTYEQRKIDLQNLTQQNMINGALENWFMLEKFRTNGNSEGVYTSYDINGSLFNARYMKAFEWTDALITNMENGISRWKQLEYFKLENTFAIDELPQDMNQLQNIKVLFLWNVGLESFPESICNMKQLTILEFIGADTVKEIPHCILYMESLRQMIIEGLALNSTFIDLFALPQLIELSLVDALIDYQSLIEYNLPSDININDMNATHDWFNLHFRWNSDAIYWLQNNPICGVQMNNESIPIKLRQFIASNATKCETPCRSEESFGSLCKPRKWGDGKCDSACNSAECDFDGGDCAMLCFSQLTQCSWELFTNDECDEECNNEYCTGYHWRSYFQTPFYTLVEYDNYTEILSGDNQQCTGYHREVVFDANECRNSNSSYLDIPPEDKLSVISFVLFQNTAADIQYNCDEFDVDDGLCYDQCRTEQCLYDGNDCELGCRNDNCYQIFLLWLRLTRSATHNVHYDIVCNEWVTKNKRIGFDIATNPAACQLFSEYLDFNDDRHMNFREFTFLMLSWAGGDSTLDFAKVVGANCSACTGVKNYNVKFQEN